MAVAPLKDDNFAVAGVKDVIAAAEPAYEVPGKADNLRAVYPDAHRGFPEESREAASEFIDEHLKP